MARNAEALDGLIAEIRAGGGQAHAFTCDVTDSTSVEHTVKDILGHSQIALTADLYGHLFMSVARQAVAGMDAALNPGGYRWRDSEAKLNDKLLI